ncbi:hypothetical protein DFS34DRAFT_689362 [Phlyctochytrium arcticum]|nr:hypothetical protein DFS34DRAFT_689362 [Phlyctochytrium arcticum]
MASSETESTPHGGLSDYARLLRSFSAVAAAESGTYDDNDQLDFGSEEFGNGDEAGVGYVGGGGLGEEEEDDRDSGYRFPGSPTTGPPRLKSALKTQTPGPSLASARTYRSMSSSSAVTNNTLDELPATPPKTPLLVNRSSRDSGFSSGTRRPTLMQRRPSDLSMTVDDLLKELNSTLAESSPEEEGEQLEQGPYEKMRTRARAHTGSSVGGGADGETSPYQSSPRSRAQTLPSSHMLPDDAYLQQQHEILQQALFGPQTPVDSSNFGGGQSETQPSTRRRPSQLPTRLHTASSQNSLSKATSPSSRHNPAGLPNYMSRAATAGPYSAPLKPPPMFPPPPSPSAGVLYHARGTYSPAGIPEGEEVYHASYTQGRPRFNSTGANSAQKPSFTPPAALPPPSSESPLPPAAPAPPQKSPKVAPASLPVAAESQPPALKTGIVQLKQTSTVFQTTTWKKRRLTLDPARGILTLSRVESSPGGSASPSASQTSLASTIPAPSGQSRSPPQTPPSSSVLGHLNLTHEAASVRVSENGLWVLEILGPKIDSPSTRTAAKDSSIPSKKTKMWAIKCDGKDDMIGWLSAIRGGMAFWRGLAATAGSESTPVGPAAPDKVKGVLTSTDKDLTAQILVVM